MSIYILYFKENFICYKIQSSMIFCEQISKLNSKNETFQNLRVNLPKVLDIFFFFERVN